MKKAQLQQASVFPGAFVLCVSDLPDDVCAQDMLNAGFSAGNIRGAVPDCELFWGETLGVAVEKARQSLYSPREMLVVYVDSRKISVATSAVLVDSGGDGE